MKPINVEKLQKLLIRKWRKTYDKRVQDMRSTDLPIPPPVGGAPAVCVWTERGRDEPGFYATPHGLCHINHLPRSGGCWCGKPIKFTEAK